MSVYQIDIKEGDTNVKSIFRTSLLSAADENWVPEVCSRSRAPLSTLRRSISSFAVTISFSACFPPIAKADNVRKIEDDEDAVED